MQSAKNTTDVSTIGCVTDHVSRYYIVYRGEHAGDHRAEQEDRDAGMHDVLDSVVVQPFVLTGGIAQTRPIAATRAFLSSGHFASTDAGLDRKHGS